MTKHTAAFTSAIVLVLGIAAFTGSALAGNGTGSAPQDPGNSANAPGQVNKTDTATPQSSASTMGGADANADASQSGVKPTSSTAHGNHNTSCTTGGGTGSSATCTSSGANAATTQTAAHADASKRYGSGQTAAQIANSNGAPAGTTLTGPGNSQPHKVTDCKHKHAVDVHAVKSYSSAACTSPTAGSTGTSTSTTSSTSTSTTSKTSSTAGATVTGNVSGTTATGTSATASGNTQAVGVLGATAAGKGKSGPQGGVLGAIQASLPFTGFPLWLPVAAAVALIALGLVLRRRARMLA